jgi:dihydropteroate synthase
MVKFMDKKGSVSVNYKSKHPVVMGILNVTDDSFFSSSRCQSTAELLKKVDLFTNNGVSILDVGACSTRPGATFVSEKEELERLLPALEVLRNHYPDSIISVDTFRGNVVRKVVEEFDVDIINDVFSFDKDETMLDVVASLNRTYVLMHSGEINTGKSDFMKEIFRFFVKKIKILEDRGVKDIIIDPGYGFGKTMEQNFQLLSHQSELLQLGYPILAGLSRKRMVWQSLNVKVEEALNGTTVLNTIALQQGAHILRVHDVKEAMEAIKLWSLCQNNH